MARRHREAIRPLALPLARPALATIGIFLFMSDWNDLLYWLPFIRSQKNRTVPLALPNSRGCFLLGNPPLLGGCDCFGASGCRIRAVTAAVL